MVKLKRNKFLNTNAVYDAYGYQREAVDAIKDRDFGAIFHEQGLGKTKIAIDLILHWLTTGEIDSAVIVTKRSLVENWRGEIATHTHIVPTILTQSRRMNFYAFNSPVKVYLCHYEVIHSELKRMKIFGKTRELAILLDESQKIKNPDAKLTQSYFELSPYIKKRVILTGTPIANRPYDIWSQVKFLDHGRSLGTNFDNFKKNLDLTGELRIDSNSRNLFESGLQEIWRKVKDFSVRETKAGAGIDLPQKHYEVISTGWENDQQCLYKQVRKEMRATLVQNGLPVLDESEDILKRLLRLTQITSNPSIIDETYSNLPGKYYHLIALLSKITGMHEKAIVWTSFIKNVEWLKHHLRDYSPCFVHGSMSIEDRNRNINSFKVDDGRKVLVATPGAAKEGLTLTVANHVIFYDRTFSLDDYLQAQDRIHRISQKKECYIYNLIMRDSIDEWINILIKAKHIAAQFGQGDIDINEFRKEIDYSFQEILTEILN